MASASSWKLRCELVGHEQDVRGCCSTPDGAVATCSRDTTVRLFTLDGACGIETNAFFGHQHFVGCVAYLPPCSSRPAGAFISGGNDRTISGQTVVEPVINLWDGGSGQLVASLKGHTLTVCGLSVSAATGQLMSVSWDKTGRIWDLASLSCHTILQGHEAAVWAALQLDDGTVLTGSADKTIKQWRGSTCVNTFRGHTDCVRSLAKIEIGFASAGNDAVIRLCTLSGECLLQLTGHTSFIYSIAVLATGEIVSSSEDKTARVWRDGECVGVMQHAGSVWCVAALPDGDMVTGCSDAVARVWTRDPSRMADAATLQRYDQMLSQQTISAQEVGGVQLDKLPGIEALETPGNKDGATKIVRVGTSAFAYAWNASESKWDQIGTVVDGPAGGGGGGGKVHYNGVEYDKVFDIEVDEGVTLKCGYNFGQNPYEVAQDFIWANDLPQDHLEEIARFIDRNANQGVTLGADTMPTRGSDPLTGGHNAMYETPSAASLAQGSGPAAPAPAAPQQHIPKKTMIFFEQLAKADAVGRKLTEFNQTLSASPDAPLRELALKDEEAALLIDVIQHICSGESLWRPPAGVYGLVVTKLLSWPPAYLFPTLDALRMLVLNPYAAKHLSATIATADVITLVAAALQRARADPAALPLATRIMALRFFVNCFRLPDLRPLVIARCEGVLAAARVCLVPHSLANAQVQAAFGTLLLNYSVAAFEGAGGDALGGQAAVVGAVAAAAEFLSAVGGFPEIQAAAEAEGPYRGLAAVGTLLTACPAGVPAAREHSIPSLVAAVAARPVGAKTVECARQLQALF